MTGPETTPAPTAGRQRKEDLVMRLRRIEGQVRGLQRMVEEERYCTDVLVQIAAVRAALMQVTRAMLEEHTRHCVGKALAGGRGDQAIDELLTVLAQIT